MHILKSSGLLLNDQRSKEKVFKMTKWYDLKLINNQLLKNLNNNLIKENISGVSINKEKKAIFIEE